MGGVPRESRRQEDTTMTGDERAMVDEARRGRLLATGQRRWVQTVSWLLLVTVAGVLVLAWVAR